MTETQLSNSVRKWVLSEGGYTIKTSDRFTLGIPDRWICIRGVQRWVELKTEKGIVSPIQWYTINQINKAGGVACVCRSLKEVQSLFKTKDGTPSIGRS